MSGVRPRRVQNGRVSRRLREADVELALKESLDPRIAAPWPVLGPVAEARCDRIESEVLEAGQVVLARLNETSLVSTLNESASPAVSEVELLNVLGREELHAHRERRLRGLDK